MGIGTKEIKRSDLEAKILAFVAHNLRNDDFLISFADKYIEVPSYSGYSIVGDNEEWYNE